MCALHCKLQCPGVFIDGLIVEWALIGLPAWQSGLQCNYTCATRCRWLVGAVGGDWLFPHSPHRLVSVQSNGHSVSGGHTFAFSLGAYFNCRLPFSRLADRQTSLQFHAKTQLHSVAACRVRAFWLAPVSVVPNTFQCNCLFIIIGPLFACCTHWALVHNVQVQWREDYCLLLGGKHWEERNTAISASSKGSFFPSVYLDVMYECPLFTCTLSLPMAAFACLFCQFPLYHFLVIPASTAEMESLRLLFGPWPHVKQIETIQLQSCFNLNWCALVQLEITLDITLHCIIHWQTALKVILKEPDQAVDKPS